MSNSGSKSKFNENNNTFGTADSMVVKGQLRYSTTSTAGKKLVNETNSDSNVAVKDSADSRRSSLDKRRHSSLAGGL